MKPNSRFAIFHCRVLQSLSFGILLLFFSAGCSDEPGPEESGEPRQEQAVAAEVPDSIEVMDDERSLERRINDTAIAAQVRIALVDARELRQYSFDPVVVNGRVMLRGEVETQQERNRAEAVARDVSGVRDVTNEITALQQPAAEQPDDDNGAQEQLAEADAPDTESEAASPDASTADASQGEDAVAQEEESAPQEEETYHTVSSGESLWTISRRHGVSIDQIRRLNNLSGNNLRPGQRLRVK